ncbi:MAG TPA: adenylate/guanylate cyclase domain-containing protein [Oscillatoriaceae cyanobacterium M33_DOE_052]|uniref:Adenylate/guanylate cyclase domain-containing protein n=1 Tax=Planktothricoides sp. SpSt-374 TaxID=2282167 RepID=A0A7C3VLZ9_9CYAN|nr:adenylate/guanylate cyclase domain-containing protein [Oscillatoriaceae cyanobacterium M33_DOE_052]
MFKDFFLNFRNNSLEERLQGSRFSAFLSEILSNSGHFLIVNSLSEMVLMGWQDYLGEPGHFIIILAMLTQSWYLSGTKANRLWGNLIGPLIYTLSDLPIEGIEFFQEPNHFILWVFCLIIATFQGIRFDRRWRQSFWLIIPLESLTRTSMVIAQYIVLIFKAQLYALSGNSIGKIVFFPQNKFIISATIVLGVLLGLQSLQVTLQRRQLQETAGILRNLAKWGMGNHVVNQAVTNPEDLQFHRRDRAILFMDIRGFTQWCEQTVPDTVAKVLNLYYRSVEPAAAQYQPLRITLTADEIMAIYATPQEAIGAATAMQRAAHSILSSHQLGAGCAVHYGSAIEGLFGSEDVRTYTLIGDVVNTAKRLESATPAGEITISDAVYQLMQGQLKVEPRPPIAAKGKTNPLKAWRLIFT